MCSACALTAPALAIPELDWRLRLMLAVLLSTILIPVVEPLIVPPADLATAGWGLVLEVLMGGILGWSAALVIAGARLAGELVAAQAGLSTASLFDPDTGEETTVLGRLYGWIALAVFLALDGPLILIGALIESYRAVPAGRLLISQETADLAFGQVGRALELSLRVAAPPALALTLAGIVLGWLSRAAPSLPFVALALPIRTVLGVLLIMLSLATLICHAGECVGHISLLIEGLACPRIGHNRRQSGAGNWRGNTGRFAQPRVNGGRWLAGGGGVARYCGRRTGGGPDATGVRPAHPARDDNGRSSRCRGGRAGIGRGSGLTARAGLVRIRRRRTGRSPGTGSRVVAPQLLAPDLSRLWTLSSGPGLAVRAERMGWSMAKAVVLVVASAWAIRSGWTDVLSLGGLEGPALARGAGHLVLQLARTLAAALLVLGVIDYALRYRRFEAMLRTTTQEQREDRRVIEGDPAARAQRRRISREFRAHSPEVLTGATLIVGGTAGLTLVLGGGPPPRRITIRTVAKGSTGTRLRRSGAASDIPVVDAPELARRLARRPSSRSPLAAELIAELAAIWPVT